MTFLHFLPNGGREYSLFLPIDRSMHFEMPRAQLKQIQQPNSTIYIRNSGLELPNDRFYSHLLLPSLSHRSCHLRHLKGFDRVLGFKTGSSDYYRNSHGWSHPTKCWRSNQMAANIQSLKTHVPNNRALDTDTCVLHYQEKHSYSNFVIWPCIDITQIMYK